MEIYRKNAGRKASLRSQNAHGHVSSAILCGNLQENAGRKYRVTRFVRACAVKMHMDMSQAPQEPFCTEIYKENAERPGYDVDQPAGPNTYRKNPSVWPHCLGKKRRLPHQRLCRQVRRQGADFTGRSIDTEKCAVGAERNWPKSFT